MSVFFVLGNAILFLSAGLCIFWFSGKKTPLYFRILMLATACYATVSLFRAVYYFCYGSFYREPGITFLGFFGCFLFLFSANFGQFDSLIDDRSSALMKYRLIALAAPAVLLFFLAVFALTAKDLLPTLPLIVTVVGFLPAVPASYYNLKHLLMPDMGFSFSKGVRLCNLFALLAEVFELARLYASAAGEQTAENVFLFCVALSFLGLTLFAKRGMKLWYL